MSREFSFPPPPPPPPKAQPPRHHLAEEASIQQQPIWQDTRSNRPYTQAVSSQMREMGSRLPAGSYINPNFHKPSWHNDGTQYGSIQAAQSTSRQRPSDAVRARNSTGFDKTAPGHKRKLEALRGPPSAKHIKPGPEIAPAVPVFGSPLPANVNPQAATQPKKPSNSLFGVSLSQTEPEYSESDIDDDEDDDLDEESMFAQLGNKLVFEHEGNVVSLTSEADLARWRQERQKRFPTSHRIAMRYHERCAIGEERKRLLAGAYALRRPNWLSQSAQHPSRRAVEAPAPDMKKNTSTFAVQETKPSLLGIDQYDSDEEETEEMLSQHEQDNNTKKPPDDTSEDEGPEQASSKQDHTTISTDDRPACKYFFATGKCRDGDACRYRHEGQSGHIISKREKPRTRTKHDTTQKRGIHHLLLAQENAAADALALKVIKYLGSIDFFKAEVPEQ